MKDAIRTKSYEDVIEMFDGRGLGLVWRVGEGGMKGGGGGGRESWW